jgi:hypothetical protein
METPILLAKGMLPDLRIAPIFIERTCIESIKELFPTKTRLRPKGDMHVEINRTSRNTG